MKVFLVKKLDESISKFRSACEGGPMVDACGCILLVGTYRSRLRDSFRVPCGVGRKLYGQTVKVVMARVE